MAGLIGIATTPSAVAVTGGGGWKTILQWVMPANHRGTVRQWAVWCDGTTSNATPIEAQLVRQTTAGTMSAVTLVKKNASDDETLLSAAQHTATVEPTTTDVLEHKRVHPQSPGYELRYSIDDMLAIAGGGRVAIRVRAAANINVDAEMEVEE